MGSLTSVRFFNVTGNRVMPKPSDFRSAPSAALTGASRLVKAEAAAVAVVGVLIGVVSTISGNFIVSGIVVAVSSCLAYALLWGGRRLRDGHRSGAVMVLAVTLLLTVYSIGMFVMLIAAVPGWLASVRVVRNWHLLNRESDGSR